MAELAAWTNSMHLWATNRFRQKC